MPIVAAVDCEGMDEATRIADELSRSLRGPAWHGCSLNELLSDVTAETANVRVWPSAHTIHEIVLHIITWQEIGRRVLEGEPVPPMPFPDDWPSPPERLQWSQTVERLHHSTDALIEAVTRLSESALGDLVPGRDYSVYVLLHGIAQHKAYHGGQIALLKKASAHLSRTS